MLADNVQKLGSHGMLTKTQMTDVSMFGVVHFIENKNLICITIAIISTPETRFSEPQFSEILDLMKKLQLPFSFRLNVKKVWQPNSLNRVSGVPFFYSLHL